MLKRFMYAAALTGFSLLAMGCSLGSYWPYNTEVGSWSRIIAAYLREDLGS